VSAVLLTKPGRGHAQVERVRPKLHAEHSGRLSMQLAADTRVYSEPTLPFSDVSFARDLCFFSACTVQQLQIHAKS
jgi:hypothetical protein